MARYKAEMFETIVIRKLYEVNASNYAEAQEKFLTGDTVFEETLFEEKVLNRDFHTDPEIIEGLEDIN